MTKERRADWSIIGVDTGGTFTDTVVVLPDGGTLAGKAPSTPDQVEVGVMDSLAAAAAKGAMTRRELLASAVVIAHGTTVGLNALLTARGARVGLLTTAGFESVLPIAKANKIHGLDEADLIRPSRWAKPDLLVPRERILGVTERIDAFGDVLVPLDEEQARGTIRRLADTGVESIAIALLWSTANHVHEERLAALVVEELGDMHVSVSSQLVPRIGEYERTSTVVLDAYVAPLVSGYLTRLEARLRAEEFDGRLLVLRMGGGVGMAEEMAAAPVHTLQSGPVGGLAAAARIGSSLGQPDVITTDVGGTSFDVGLVIAGGLPTAQRPMVDRQALAVPVIDVKSIGTGGGSIAWFDAGLGVLRVGPRSAGSVPGPACYGLGGEDPTLTDAAVALGWLRRLGDGRELDSDAASAAIETHLAGPMGVTVAEAADGILRVACSQMHDLIRRTTVERGHDPSQFALYAFGGAGPQYAAWYAQELGVSDVVVPALAAELSAWGAASSDLVLEAGRDLPPAPVEQAIHDVPEFIARLEVEVEQRLSGQAEDLAARFGTTPALRRSVGLRFSRQRRRIAIELPPGPVGSHSVATIIEAFRARYEDVVGAGTAQHDAPIELVDVSVALTVALPATRFDCPGGGAGVPVEHRDAWFAGREQSCPVWDWSDLALDQELVGPGFVQSNETTVVIPPAWCAWVDHQGNVHLRAPEGQL